MAAEAGELLADGHAERALRCAEEAASLWRGRPYGRGGRPTVGPRGGRPARGDPRQPAGDARRHPARHGGRALAELETALADEPLRERLWASRMIAYRALGRRSEALAACIGARTALVEELGITWPTSCASSSPRLQGRCKARVVD
jgi:hypothetical protein